MWIFICTSTPMAKEEVFFFFLVCRLRLLQNTTTELHKMQRKTHHMILSPSCCLSSHVSEISWLYLHCQGQKAQSHGRYFIFSGSYKFSNSSTVLFPESWVQQLLFNQHIRNSQNSYHASVNEENHRGSTLIDWLNGMNNC